MTDQKWRSPTGHPIASHETDKLRNAGAVDKIDDMVIDRIKAQQQPDVNAELLGALKIATEELDEHSKCEDCRVGVPLNILNQCHGAIARAEQKGGE